MKLWRLLALPGYALSQTARVVWLVPGGLLFGGAILLSVFTYTDTVRWLQHAAYAWAAMNMLAWLFLASTVLLAREARRLRLPRLEHAALASLSLYGVLGIALPAVLLGWMNGHGLALAIIMLFGAGLGLAYALLPAYLSPLVIFAPGFPAVLSAWLSLPQPMQPGFDAWAGPAVAVFWLLLAWRFGGLLGGDHSLQAPHAPTLMIFKQMIERWQSGSASTRGAACATGRGPGWARPVVDLKDCAPQNPVRSLRVALGGWGIPQTGLSRLWQLTLLLFGLLLGAGFVFTQMIADQQNHAPNVWRDLGSAGSLLFFGTLMSSILAIQTVRALYRRWDQGSAELSLLALLPGLGSTRPVNCALVAAALLPGIGAQFSLTLLLLLVSVCLHMSAATAALMLLAPLGSTAMMCSFVLMIFAGGPLRGWGMAAAVGASYVWICVGSMIPLFGTRHHAVLGDVALLILATGWSALFVALLWLGRRGWRGLQRRPHPFLPH